MVTFKDKYALTGRVRPKSNSQIALPIPDSRRKLRFSFSNNHFHVGNRKITKQDAFNLAKWILSHE